MHPTTWAPGCSVQCVTPKHSRFLHLHPCTPAPLHPCTPAPLHPCTPAPLHPSCTSFVSRAQHPMHPRLCRLRGCVGWVRCRGRCLATARSGAGPGAGGAGPAASPAPRRPVRAVCSGQGVGHMRPGGVWAGAAAPPHGTRRACVQASVCVCTVLWEAACWSCVRARGSVCGHTHATPPPHTRPAHGRRVLCAGCAALPSHACACHVCMCVRVHVCMCVRVHVCMCARVHVCMCARVHVCMCA
jgi:hypothetical protein